MTDSPTIAQAPVRLVLFALAMGGFAIGTTEFAAMSLVPYFSPALGIDAATASHVISAYALGVVVGAPVLAVLGARMPRKRLLLILMAVFGLANVAAALSPSYPVMLLFRFMAGLPHGAYFGVASLMAASLVPPNRRTWAVSMLMIGLTIATVLGVPMANVMGQTIGWRWGFGVVGVLALLTFVLILRLAPDPAADPGANPLRELSALGNRQVWLTLLTGAVGFGGLFAVYTYVASTLLTVTMAPEWAVPIVFMVFGLGMTAGTLIVGRIADRGLMATAAGILIFSAVMLFLYPFSVHSLWTIAPCVFLIGAGGSLGLVLQTRLMDVAGDAQTLAAALNHSAFNAANALGPWLAAMVLTAGYGFPASGFVGSALALGGLLLLGVTVWDARRSEQRSGVACSVQPCE
ncbi:MFS transporter [Haematobacter genomosp. 1]|uniref:MFS transporter n=1 Tax=Haematobacter genomosp. 1 TaxID=366618 RepID=A0A212AH10_9RHOB|nr:MFS transporter [Haematobacter genomosp. 1]OWJ80729.1 MFS transporter [Haematobacter genomosp. 1]